MKLTKSVSVAAVVVKSIWGVPGLVNTASPMVRSLRIEKSDDEVVPVDADERRRLAVLKKVDAATGHLMRAASAVHALACLLTCACPPREAR